ncbi:probable Bax inhibitor 1 [Copidosoma floridanum]|uniref:probable Bax inhibitor 1 n=1 Tax=Copidosoma floridanum TaxID=29053 RepID=UPI0006C9D086|nr:probable Bax inhibitor 1 [Copidosoma floridanum]
MCFREPPVRKHLKNVYSCLSLSTLTAAVGVYIHLYTHLLRAGILTSLGAIGLIIILLNTSDNGKNQHLRLVCLLGFAFLSGLGICPLLEMVILINPSIIVSALVGTSVIFVSFTISALLSKRGQWLYLGGILISILNTMLLSTFINFFFNWTIISQVQLYIGLLVMSAFVIYDTQVIIQKSRMGNKDYVIHSLDLFLDFINIFRYLIIILTQKEQKNNKRKE